MVFEQEPKKKHWLQVKQFCGKWPVRKGWLYSCYCCCYCFSSCVHLNVPSNAREFFKAHWQVLLIQCHNVAHVPTLCWCCVLGKRLFDTVVGAWQNFWEFHYWKRWLADAWLYTVPSTVTSALCQDEGSLWEKRLFSCCRNPARTPGFCSESCYQPFLWISSRHNTFLGFHFLPNLFHVRVVNSSWYIIQRNFKQFNYFKAMIFYAHKSLAPAIQHTPGGVPQKPTDSSL